MTAYVALLRGIMPTNPNMRNEKLRGVFESLGYEHVETVIASGNVLFEAKSKSSKALETAIQNALQEQLGLSSAAIVRSKEEIAALVKKDPFKGMTHSKQTSLNVTFVKSELKTKIKFPYRAEGYVVKGAHDRSLLSVIDISTTKTPDVMRWLEKEFGKDITTRTWGTIQKLAKRFEAYG